MTIRVVNRRIEAAARDDDNLLALLAANVEEWSMIFTDRTYRGRQTSDCIIKTGMALHTWVNYKVEFVGFYRIHNEGLF